jgi:hypothetical protein
VAGESWRGKWIAKVNYYTVLPCLYQSAWLELSIDDSVERYVISLPLSMAWGAWTGKGGGWGESNQLLYI